MSASHGIFVVGIDTSAFEEPRVVLAYRSNQMAFRLKYRLVCLETVLTLDRRTAPCSCQDALGVTLGPPSGIPSHLSIARAVFRLLALKDMTRTYFGLFCRQGEDRIAA